MSKEITPEGDFYKDSYPLSESELGDFFSVPLSPAEALRILVNHQRKLGELDRLALKEIAGSDEPDFTPDFKKIRERIARELGIEEED